MNLIPSLAPSYIDQRQLFAWELYWGGNGQIALSAGTNVPTSSAYAFYQVSFLTSSVVLSAGFRRGYTGSISNMTFPANYTWVAPMSSFYLNSGTGIAYEYKINNLDDPNACAVC